MSKKKKSPALELTEKGFEFFMTSDFAASEKYFAEALTHKFGVDAALGKAFCTIHAGRFAEAAAFLEETGRKYHRFDFKRLSSLITGYCHIASGMKEAGNKWFDDYTTKLLLDAEEEDEKLQEKTAAGNDEDYEDFEEQDEYYAASYSNEEKAENEYQSAMAFFNQYLVQLPDIVQSYLTYLDGNKKWLKADETSREIIGYELLEWIRILWENSKDAKRFPSPDPQWKELGYKCSDLVLQYWPGLDREVDNRKKEFEKPAKKK